MLHRGLDFQTVRVRCRSCGWFRNVAHTGCADGKRALVFISRSPDLSHVLHAKVIEVPEERPLDAVLQEHPNYRDLDHDARSKGLFKVMAEYKPLLEGQACPRCKTVGKLELEQTWEVKHVRY